MTIVWSASHDLGKKEANMIDIRGKSAVALSRDPKTPPSQVPRKTVEGILRGLDHVLADERAESIWRASRQDPARLHDPDAPVESRHHGARKSVDFRPGRRQWSHLRSGHGHDAFRHNDSPLSRELVQYPHHRAVYSGVDPILGHRVQRRRTDDPLHADPDAVNMPAFGAAYSDGEIASVVNYVTARFGARPSALTVERVAKLRQAD
jgi:hypothetical protein